MKDHTWGMVCLVAFAVVFSSDARAQQDSDTVKQLWPEVDVYVSLNEKFRLFFLATTTKAEETRDNTEGQVGAHIDYHLNNRISLRAGYRYGFSLGGSLLGSTDPSSNKRCVNRCRSRRSLVIGTVRSYGG